MPNNKRVVRRLLKPDLAAIKAVAESCDKLRDEWRECGGDPSKWPRIFPWPNGEEEGVCALFLMNCSGLVALPDAIGDLISIKYIDLKGCNNLCTLPDTISKLGSLERLHVSGCASLTLPPAISALCALTHLGLDAPRLKVCGRCRSVHATYCGVECQRTNWDQWHKHQCRAIRSRKKRTCDVCHRIAKYDSPVFPVCDCGARRYCGEECQAKDWAAGHSETCASRDLY